MPGCEPGALLTLLRALRPCELSGRGGWWDGRGALGRGGLADAGLGEGALARGVGAEEDEAALLPCLATGTPDAATTRLTAVDTFSV